MPQFFPDHQDAAGRKGDSTDLHCFLRGYMACAEWLAMADSDDCPDLSDAQRSKARGWTRYAQREARADCRAFLKAHKADLATYCELRQCDLESAGHDFWLSRSGHGAGFFDRGDDPVFDRLQDAARVWSECISVLTPRGYYDFL